MTIDDSSYEKGEDVSHPNPIVVYTDGSRKKDAFGAHVGCGYLATRIDSKGKRITVGQEAFPLQHYNPV